MRAEVVEAFGAPDVPFEHLVRELDTKRDESRFPIYQAFFSFQDARQRPPAWGDLEHQNLPVFQPAAAQDVALWFLDNVDGLVGGLNYNTDILEAETAAPLAPPLPGPHRGDRRRSRAAVARAARASPRTNARQLAAVERHGGAAAPPTRPCWRCWRRIAAHGDASPSASTTRR